jgi:hypothetical protein
VAESCDREHGKLGPNDLAVEAIWPLSTASTTANASRALEPSGIGPAILIDPSVRPRYREGDQARNLHINQEEAGVARATHRI